MSVALERVAAPVLVIGAYGYGNVGDEAILAGLLAKLGDRSATVVSRDPAATTRLHGVSSVGIGAAFPALLRHRSVVIGGGGLFGRDMGAIGRLLPLFGLISSSLGREVVIEGVDIDATLAPIARVLVPPLMRRASAVTVRDHGSVAILDRWGVRANLAPDLSHWMPMGSIASGRRLLRDAGVDTRLPVVGLALTGVRPDLANAALTAAAGAIDALPDAQFCFIPLSRHPRVATHDDRRLAHQLRRMRPRLAVVETEVHPSIVLSAVSQLSAVVSMRYHGMLFAERTRVPLVPIAYAEKNVRWLEERGMHAIPADADALTSALRDALVADHHSVNRPELVAS
jgi:polysaccharide pyruvyl transferase WcaK-like protein